MEANRRCKIAEETIEYETTNVKLLSNVVEDKVKAVCYYYYPQLK